MFKINKQSIASLSVDKLENLLRWGGIDEIRARYSADETGPYAVTLIKRGEPDGEGETIADAVVSAARFGWFADAEILMTLENMRESTGRTIDLAHGALDGDHMFFVDDRCVAVGKDAQDALELGARFLSAPAL